jgi:hypothetical protein
MFVEEKVANIESMLKDDFPTVGLYFLSLLLRTFHFVSHRRRSLKCVHCT